MLLHGSRRASIAALTACAVGALLLSGCASTGGEVAASDGHFKVVKQGGSRFASLATLEDDALLVADRYCSALRKGLQVTAAQKIPRQRSPDGLPRVEVNFSCLAPASMESQ